MSKLIIAQTAAVTPGSPGSLFGTAVKVDVVSGSNSMVPAGHWMIPGVAAVTIMIQGEAGSLVALTAAGSGVGSILSDGASVQLEGSAAATVYLYPYLD